MYPPLLDDIVARNRFIIWYGFRRGSEGGAGGRGDVGVVTKVFDKLADCIAETDGDNKSVCMVSGIDKAIGFNLDGIETFRAVPFWPVDDGKGGGCSDGDIWIVGFRAG